MNSRDRVLTTFDHQEPDRVPIYDNIYNREVFRRVTGLNIDIDQILNAVQSSSDRPPNPLVAVLSNFVLNNPKNFGFIVKLFNRFIYRRLYERLGIDVLGAPVGMIGVPNLHPHKDKGGHIVPADGKLYRYASDGTPRYIGGAFKTEDDYHTYIQYNTSHPLQTYLFEAFQKANPNLLVMPSFGFGFFDSIWQMFGFDTFSRFLYQKPAFLRQVIKDLERFYFPILQQVIELGAEIIYFGDDLGYKDRPFISPRIYRQFFKPSLRRLCQIAHKGGAKVLMHSDGNINPLLEDLIDAGIDGLHPWEAAAGMQITEGKKQYGDKLTLIGHVPVQDLTHHTPREIKKLVLHLLKYCAPGGGYLISSGHSVTKECQWYNYFTMIETVKRFGIYPIQIP